MERKLREGIDNANACIDNNVSRKADMKRFSADAAACSKFARLYAISANAKNAVCAAIPPRPLLTASSAYPDDAAVTDVVIPDNEVDAPMNRAPIIASPIPVLWARSRAVFVILTPNHPITTVTVANAAIMYAKGQLPISVNCLPLTVTAYFCFL